MPRKTNTAAATARAAADGRRKPAPKAGAKAPAKAARGDARRAAAAASVAAPVDAMAARLFGAGTDGEMGGAVVDSATAALMICGLPVPAFSVRYLLGQDVLALGRAMMLIGVQHSCKSALLFEIYRWVLAYQGMVEHHETENKDAPDLRNAIYRHDPSFMRRTRYNPADSTEEWQEHLTDSLVRAEALFARQTAGQRGAKRKDGESAEEYRKRTGPKTHKDRCGWIYPIVHGIDCLTAVSSDKTIASIEDEGFAKRRYQIEAQLLSDYVKTLPHFLRNRPILLVATNHNKPVTHDDGRVEDKVPGGRAMRFMDTLEFGLEQVPGGRVGINDNEARRIRIRSIKNSLAPNQRQIDVDLAWWYEWDEAAEAPVQQVVWNWHKATIDLLLAQEKIPKFKKRWDAMREFLDLRPVKGPRIWSKALGIPESDPATYDEAGAAIEANPDVLRGLYRVFNIQRRTVFTPGQDYTDLKAQRRAMAEAVATVYDVPDLSAVSHFDAELDEAIAAVVQRRDALAHDDDED